MGGWFCIVAMGNVVGAWTLVHHYVSVSYWECLLIPEVPLYITYIIMMCNVMLSSNGFHKQHVSLLLYMTRYSQYLSGHNNQQTDM